MATPAQITANRANAQHSTGPQTGEGKLASSSNSLRTGLASAKLFVRSDEQREFDIFQSDLLENLKPEGPLQSHFFEILLHAAWNIKRCLTIEAEIQSEADSKGFSDAMLDDDLSRKLDRVYRYKKMHESTQKKCLTELRILQTEQFWRNENEAGQEESVLTDACSVVRKLRREEPSPKSDTRAAYDILNALTAPPAPRRSDNSRNEAISVSPATRKAAA